MNEGLRHISLYVDKTFTSYLALLCFKPNSKTGQAKQMRLAPQDEKFEIGGIAQIVALFANKRHIRARWLSSADDMKASKSNLASVSAQCTRGKKGVSKDAPFSLLRASQKPFVCTRTIVATEQFLSHCKRVIKLNQSFSQRLF